MTIKEIEARSGMTRANVRFYEKEGLLSPEKSANGYRNYSEADLAALLRVRLLRTLHLSLEEIRQLQQGEAELAQVLTAHLDSLSQEQHELEQAQRVCRLLCQRQVQYASLNAEKYLLELTRREDKPVPELESDRIPIPFIPWRRFLARCFDLELCRLLLYVPIILVLQLNPFEETNELLTNLVWGIFGIAVMLALEPLCLHRFGTTPGKWIFGIRVTELDGEKLSLGAAYLRTAKVALWGCGLGIPLFTFICNFWWYTHYSREQPFRWEDNSCLTVKDKRIWRSVLFALLGVLLLLVNIAVLSSRIPGTQVPNRGDVSTAEFYENYAACSDFYGDLTYADLEENWLVDWNVEQEQGVVTAVSLELGPDETDHEDGISLNTDALTCCIWAFVGTEYADFSKRGELYELVQQVENDPMANFSLSLGDFTVSTELEYEGYEILNQPTFFGAFDGTTYLHRLFDEENSYFHYTFRIEKN